MEFMEVLYYTTLILCFFLILNLIYTIIKSKCKLEWKIANVTNTIFLALLFLSTNRLISKLPNNNIFDYLLVAFNGGLYLVGSIASKNIRRS